MCGIFGIIKKPIALPKMLHFMQQAIVTNTFRGIDSTGIVSVDKDGEILTYKKALAGWDMQYQPKAMSLLTSLWDKRFVFVHNRHATRGEPNVSNAHPFISKHITLIHNGTVNTTNLKGASIVDSQKITQTMAEIGEQETLSLLDGSFVLVWYNTEDNTFNLARNDQRELALAYMKNNDAVLFASEGMMLDWLCVRNNIEISKIEELPVLKHYKIPLDHTKKMIINPIEEYEPPKTHNVYPKIDNYAPRSINSTNGVLPAVDLGEQFTALCEGKQIIELDGKDQECYVFRQRRDLEPGWYIPIYSKRMTYIDGRWYRLRAKEMQLSRYSNRMYKAILVRRLSAKAELKLLHLDDLEHGKKCFYNIGENVSFAVTQVIKDTFHLQTNTFNIIGETIDQHRYPTLVYWQPRDIYENFTACLYDGVIKSIQPTTKGFNLILDENSITMSLDAEGEWVKPDTKEVDKSSHTDKNVSRCAICRDLILDSGEYTLTKDNEEVHTECFEEMQKHVKH